MAVGICSRQVVCLASALSDATIADELCSIEHAMPTLVLHACRERHIGEADGSMSDLRLSRDAMLALANIASHECGREAMMRGDGTVTLLCRIAFGEVIPHLALMPACIHTCLHARMHVHMHACL